MTADHDQTYYGKRIHLLWSTIRPTRFNDVYQEWIDKSNFPENIVPHILVETAGDKNKIHVVPGQSIVVSKSRVNGVAYPSYVLSSGLADKALDDHDLVIFASDDFHPMEGWDRALLNEYARFDGGLLINDGIKREKTDIVSIPIMSYRTLKKLKHIIYHPAYNHCWADNELYLNLEELGLLSDISESKPDIYFQHKHFTNAGRQKDINDVLASMTYATGKNIWKIRKQLPLEKRLEVSLDEKLLSILILTIPGREHLLARLLGILEPQLDDDVEVLVEYDHGELSRGEKRNRVLDKAKGRYLCFIDDDDRVSDNYVHDILSVLRKFDVDCCTLSGEISIDGGTPRKFIHSLEYKKYCVDGKGPNTVYYRSPNHLNVIKREIVKWVRFDDRLSHGEDLDFAKRVLQYLSVQGQINKVLYYYDAVSQQRSSQNNSLAQSLCRAGFEFLKQQTVLLERRTASGLIFYSSYTHLMEITAKIDDRVDQNTPLGRVFKLDELSKTRFEASIRPQPSALGDSQDHGKLRPDQHQMLDRGGAEPKLL